MARVGPTATACSAHRPPESARAGRILGPKSAECGRVRPAKSVFRPTPAEIGPLDSGRNFEIGRSRPELGRNGNRPSFGQTRHLRRAASGGSLRKLRHWRKWAKRTAPSQLVCAPAGNKATVPVSGRVCSKRRHREVWNLRPPKMDAQDSDVDEKRCFQDVFLPWSRCSRSEQVWPRPARHAADVEVRPHRVHSSRPGPLERSTFPRPRSQNERTPLPPRQQQ